MGRHSSSGKFVKLSARRKKNRGGERLCQWRILKKCGKLVNKSTENHEPDVTSKSEIPEASFECSKSSASSENISVVCDAEEASEEAVILTGRRIVDICHFFNEVQKVCEDHSSFDCSFKDMVLENEDVDGLHSSFIFRCQVCGILKTISSEDVRDAEMNINASAVVGIVNAGSCFTGLQQVLGAMSIPCMSSNIYTRYHDIVCDGWEQAAYTEMKDAAAEEIDLAVHTGDVDREGIPLLTVETDGSWTNCNTLSGMEDNHDEPLSDCGLDDTEMSVKEEVHRMTFVSCGVPPVDCEEFAVPSSIKTEALSPLGDTGCNDDFTNEELDVHLDVDVEKEYKLIKKEINDDDNSIDTEVQEAESTQNCNVAVNPRSLETTSNESSFCAEGFISKENPNVHSCAEHTLGEVSKEIISCNVCKKSFNQKQDLLDHMRVHTEQSFSCNVCVKSFTCKQSLLRHVFTHTGERPFSCAICMKSFTQKGILLKHLRVHTGEKPFSCNVCMMSFTQKGSLVSHMRIHTGEKSFLCDVCMNKFKRRGDLLDHKRLHTGDFFSCTVCTRSYTRRRTLLRHIRRNHTAEQPVSGDDCI